MQGVHAFKEEVLLGVVASTPGQPYSEFNVTTDRDNIFGAVFQRWISGGEIYGYGGAGEGRAGQQEHRREWRRCAGNSRAETPQRRRAKERTRRRSKMDW